jgi:hypothetical protein
MKDGRFSKELGYHTQLKRNEPSGMYHTIGFTKDEIIDLCAMVSTSQLESGINHSQVSHLCPVLEPHRVPRTALPSTATARRSRRVNSRRRPAGPRPGSQPRPHRGLQRGGIHRLQHPADGGLIRRLEPSAQRVVTDPQCGQHPRRGIGGPLADRRERLRPGQHRRHRSQ